MRLAIASVVIGIGVGLIATVWPIIWNDPPRWVLWVLFSFGGLLIIAGGLLMALIRREGASDVRERIGVKSRRGTLDVKRAKISGMDRAIDTEDTDTQLRDIDIRDKPPEE